MKKDWELTKEALDALLDWLHPDREEAAREHERIRRRLIRLFLGRGCPAAEELTDETINRVTLRVPELSNFQGDKALFFFRVADFVHREWIKEQRRLRTEPLDNNHNGVSGNWVEPDSQFKEKLDECLRRCMAELSEENRSLFLDFNDKERRAKIEHRKTLANQCGITVNALRIKAHRIRIQLRECITKCLEELPAH